MTLNDILNRDRNNFDLIRLSAALAVIFGHSFFLFPTGGYHEPVTQIIDKNFSGTLAVGTFFFLSGILIPQSFVRSNSIFRFILMRVGRIYPGATVCLLFVTLVIGPIVTIMSVRDYFLSPETYNYIRDNWSFVRWGPWPGGATIILPGVFSSNLYKAPNGSLWTLYPEIACYTFVFVFGLIGCLSSRWAVNLTAAVLVVLHFVSPSLIPYFSDDHYSDYLKIACCFLAGTVAYANRNQLVLRWWYAAALIVLAILMNRTAVAEYFIYAALLYSVLVISAAPFLLSLKLPGDYSFGVYLYGYPVQQVVANYFPYITSYPSNLVCLPAALLLGCLSWKFVERPGMEFAKRLALFLKAKREQPAREPS